MTGRLAVLFPGQGAQRPGMGRRFVGLPAWELVPVVERAVDVDLTHLITGASEADLAGTEAAQLAIFAAGLLAYESLPPSERDRVAVVAGHSVGEITALAAVGALELADAARLVAARGEAMARACATHPGSLVALRAGEATATRLACSVDDVWLAAVNSARETVLGARAEAVAPLIRQAASRRIAAVVLPVMGAFHTPLMADAAAAIERVVAGMALHAPRVPVASSVDGWLHVGTTDWDRRIVRQLTDPVRWVDAVDQIAAAGAVRTIEAGPGTVLTRFVADRHPRLVP